MKQKVKLGRKLLGFLLTLAMVVGLMPGMSLTAYATDVTEYSLWVAGTRVTSENASNIDGSSKVSYNANTNTLTLDNYSNSAVQHENGNRNVITSKGDLNIVLKGENNLTNIGDESVLGIYCSSSGNLNISGEGSLNIETKYDCIQTDGNVTIDSGTITITGIGYGKGISSASGNVIINGGELTIINKSDCIYTNHGGTTINGGNITLKSTDSAGIYGERFTIAGGTVDVDAKTGGIRSAYETTISDGKVTVKAIGDGNNSFGISGGNSLKVSGGTVTAEATGNGDCNGIWGSKIAFEGGTITAVATGASNSNGISGGQITIKGGTVTAEATGTGENSSGINGFVSLQGGTVTAKGGKIGVLGELEILDTITSFIASGTEGAVDGWVQNKVAGTGWTDVDDTGAGVDIEVSSTYRKLSETYKKVKFPAEKKQAATITKVPTAKTLTYNGQAQELVTAGEAEGGEMQYAIGKDATTAPTEGWSAAIPSKTDAGTYYVWYKAVGDADHVDSDPAVITVTISDAASSETIPDISISALPDATEGEAYNQTFTATGTQPITWSITAGALPDGLDLASNTGVISGTPTSEGTYTFTVTATNAAGSASKELSITVQNGSTIVDQGGTAPNEEKTSVENSKSEVREMVSKEVTVNDSDTVRLILNTDSKDEDSLSGEEKEAADSIKKEAEGKGLTIGSFVDLTLFFEVKDSNGNRKDYQQLNETSSPLKVKFPIPQGLQKSGRLFSIYRFHGSTVELLGQGSGDAVYVDTDKFSLYAIAYEDGAATEEIEETEKKVVKPHTHTYAWDKVEATESQDGELRYQCTECYDILVRVPLSAYYVFNANTVDKINKAKQGETVKITTDRWISFHKMVFDALSARPDVSLEVSFLDGEYKGNRVTFTIPAGADNSDLFTENNFAGFMYLGNKYGLTTEEN